MSHSGRILVAEDDAGVRDLIRTRLNAAGYDTHTAHDGLEAVRRIRELRPNGLILDINMPWLDGFGVLEAIRADANLMTTRVLVLTARHAADDVKRAVALGAKDFLTKPFNENQLIVRVARLLRAPITVPANGNDLLV
jgi:DNA-binding response OmpR family regulator